MNFVAASYYVQMSNSYVVVNLQLLHSDNQIKMTNLHVIVNPAFLRVDDAKSDAHALSDFITTTQAITGALKK
jgi:hypothetical protein